MNSVELDSQQVKNVLKECSRTLRMLQHTSNREGMYYCKECIRKLWRHRHTGFSGYI